MTISPSQSIIQVCPKLQPNSVANSMIQPLVQNPRSTTIRLPLAFIRVQGEISADYDWVGVVLIMTRSSKPPGEPKKARFVPKHADVCKYFISPSGCLVGDKCPYKHSERDNGQRQDRMDIDEEDDDLVGRRLYVKWDSALKSKYAF